MSTNKFQYWPSDGQLGSTKFTMPANAEDWPEGDALVHNFVFNEGKLVGFVDTKALIVNDSKSTTFPYDYVNIQVDKSLEGVMTFNKGERTKYLTITYTESANSGDTIVLGTKYLGCKNVNEIKAVDPDYLTNDIVDGVWTQSLADVEDGTELFSSARALVSFYSDLSSLTTLSNVSNANKYMFANCSSLTTFEANLSSLKQSSGIFMGLSKLSSFKGDLSSLTNGQAMFMGCFSLTSFSSNLSSLTSAPSMFTNCKLDTASIQNIADTINTVTGSPDIMSSPLVIDIGIGNSSPNEQEEAAFNTMVSKGWRVFVGANGTSGGPPWTPTSLTPIDGEEQQTPIPFWAKPVPSVEEHAKYVDSEGNFYNILGGNYIYGDNLETYGMFINEDDAAAQMRLTKIEK